MTDDEYERTLCQLPLCHVFKIPVRSSAAGHRASDWPTDPQWSGRVKIVAKGNTAAIFLMEANDDRVFACCSVTDDAAVERCVDSGRYFVLRITNPQGRHAFIGIAFNERNDAFDFNVALSEHKASVERSQAPIQVAASLGNLSIAEGEKIKLKNISAASPRKKASGGGAAFTLAPPPRDSHIKKGATYGGGVSGAVQKRPGQKTGGGGSESGDLLGGGDNLLSMSTPAPAPVPQLVASNDFTASTSNFSNGGNSFAASSSSDANVFSNFSPTPTTAPAPSQGLPADDMFAGFDAPAAPAAPTMPAPAAPVDPLMSTFSSPTMSGTMPGMPHMGGQGHTSQAPAVGQGFSPMPSPGIPEDPFAGFGGSPSPGMGGTGFTTTPGTSNTNFNNMGAPPAAAPPAAGVFDSFGSPTPTGPAAQQGVPHGGNSLLDF